MPMPAPPAAAPLNKHYTGCRLGRDVYPLLDAPNRKWLLEALAAGHTVWSHPAIAEHLNDCLEAIDSDVRVDRQIIQRHRARACTCKQARLLEHAA